MTDAYHARVDELPWVDPAPRNGLLEVFRRRYLLRLLVRREISARYSGSFLGLLWSYINPLSQFFIYFVVIGVLMRLHKDVPNFAIHMFCGIILVHYFQETFNGGTRSIVRNKAIVRKMAMPNEMFPVASMLVSLYHVVPQLVILVIACLAYGWTPDLGGLLAVADLALAIIMVLGTALALLFSAANVFFRDWCSVVNILTNFVRFGVPMIYPYSYGRRTVRVDRAVLPAQPDRRRGAAVPARLLGGHHRRSRAQLARTTCPTTCYDARARDDRRLRAVHPAAPRWCSAGSSPRSRSGSGR